jgi:hypothetical protein
MHSWSNSEDCSSTIGNESLHNETNDNGMKMIQFLISKGLNVRSTTFPHKDTQQETWYSADCRTANQIDHVLRLAIDSGVQ